MPIDDPEIRQEAAETEAARLKSELRRERVSRAVEQAAHRMGLAEVHIFPGLVDRSLITVDERGHVEGAERAIEVLLQSDPAIARSFHRGAGTPPRSVASPGGQLGTDR